MQQVDDDKVDPKMATNYIYKAAKAIPKEVVFMEPAVNDPTVKDVAFNEAAANDPAVTGPAADPAATANKTIGTASAPPTSALPKADKPTSSSVVFFCFFCSS